MPNKLKWKIFGEVKPRINSKVLLRKGFTARLHEADAWIVDCITHGEVMATQGSDKWVSFSELIKFLDKQ